MGHPVGADYHEAKRIAKEVGPQIEYTTRQFGCRRVLRYVGYWYIQDQQGHYDGEDSIAKEDDSIESTGVLVASVIHVESQTTFTQTLLPVVCC
jgi:hypothetical protein